MVGNRRPHSQSPHSNRDKRICEISGLDIGGGQEIVYDRYRQLRAERPSEFACDHDEYWSGYYS